MDYDYGNYVLNKMCLKRFMKGNDFFRETCMITKFVICENVCKRWVLYT